MANEVNSKKLCVYLDDEMMAGMVGRGLLQHTLGDQWTVVHISDEKEGEEVALSGMYKAMKVAVMVLDNTLLNGVTGVQIAAKRREWEKAQGLDRMPLYLHSLDNDKLKEHFPLFDNQVIPKPMKMDDAMAAAATFPK